MPISDVDEVRASPTRKKATENAHMALCRSLESAKSPVCSSTVLTHYLVRRLSVTSWQVLVTPSYCTGDVIYRSSHEEVAIIERKPTVRRWSLVALFARMSVEGPKCVVMRLNARLHRARSWLANAPRGQRAARRGQPASMSGCLLLLLLLVMQHLETPTSAMTSVISASVRCVHRRITPSPMAAFSRTFVSTYAQHSNNLLRSFVIQRLRKLALFVFIMDLFTKLLKSTLI